MARGNPLGIAGLADLARPEVRFVNRQAGSGTRMLLEMMLARDGAAGDQRLQQRRVHHSAVAAYIASGIADAGIGMQRSSRPVQARFPAPVRENDYFALRMDAADEPAMRQLLA